MTVTCISDEHNDVQEEDEGEGDMASAAAAAAATGSGDLEDDGRTLLHCVCMLGTHAFLVPLTFPVKLCH